MENNINTTSKNQNINLSASKLEKCNSLKHDIEVEFQTGNYEKAILLCKKLLFFLPEDIETYLLLSTLYLKIYDISSCITCAKKALILDENNEKVSFYVNNLLFCKGLLNLESTNKIELDLDFLSQMRTSMSKSDYYYLRAKSYLALNNLTQCINDLNTILSFDPTNEHALLFLGKVLINSQKEKEGEHFMWKANEVNPQNEEIKQFVKIMKNRMDEVLKEANVNVLKGRLKMGLLLSSKALTIFPNNPEALVLRSSIYKSMGMYNESIEDLVLAKKYISNSYEQSSIMNNHIKECLSNIYNELSQQRISESNFEEAMYYIEEAIKNNYDDILAHINKGDCYLLQKDIINAKDEYLICLNIDKNNGTAKSRLSQVLYKLAILSYNSKDYEEALEYLTQAIHYYDKYDTIYILRARSYLKLNKIKEAYEDACIAYLLNPRNQDAIEIKKFLS